MHALLSALADLLFFTYVKRTFGLGLAKIAISCRLFSWYLIYISTRSLTNMLEEAFTIMSLNCLPKSAEKKPKSHSKSEKNTKNSFWLFHSINFLSFVLRSTAAINLIPIYIFYFFILLQTKWSRFVFIIQFAFIG